MTLRESELKDMEMIMYSTTEVIPGLLVMQALKWGLSVLENTQIVRMTNLILDK